MGRGSGVGGGLTVAGRIMADSLVAAGSVGLSRGKVGNGLAEGGSGVAWATKAEKGVVVGWWASSS